MNVTLKDVAKNAGVSIHTVSDILNGGDQRYSERTQRKVQEAAQRLNYRPNRQARILRGAKSGLIGMLKPVSVIQTSAEGALYAAEAIHQEGDHDLIAFDVHWHQQGLARAVDYLLASRVEGVLLASLDGAEPLIGEAIRRLKAAGIPLVSLGGTREPGIPWIGTDYFHGGRLLGEHLLSQGRRKVAFLTGSHYLRFASVTKRLDGLKSSFEEAGLPVETVLGGAPREPDDAVSLKNFTSGDLAFRELLARHEAFDTAVCTNDYAALAVIRACQDHGIPTPDGLAVTGFDDTAMGRFTTPRLTTVAQPIREAAEKAVELLYAAMRGKPHPADEPLELPCELVVRESCGAQTTQKKEPLNVH
ncbi:MAG TPA: LacI family DNA-binding transcriptional regulator [Chthoniobacteraceae bacterium]|nr:LacI family DNA-binding transcriptional regulator [Chthoniobacteraceae bacterium]